MANFNTPPNETQDPNFLRWSRTIEQPNFKSTTGEAFKDIGNIFEQAVKGADSLVSEYATDKATKLAENKRDEFTARLETYTNPHQNPQDQSNLSNTSTAQLGPDSLNILPATQGSNLPKAIAALPNQLSTLDSARDNGKISKTYYDMTLANAAKDLRSKFPPAYSKVIDQAFERVTGSIPANAYITSMISDINANKTSQQAQTTHILNKLEETAFPGWAQMWHSIQSGQKPASAGIDFMALPASIESDFKMREMALRVKKGEREAGIEDITDLANTGVNGEVRKMWHAIDVNSGMSPEKAQQILVDIQSGKRAPLSPSESLQMSQIMAGVEQQFRVNARKLLETSKTPEGMTPFSQLSGEAQNKIIDDHAKSFQLVREAYYKGDTALAVQATAQIQALKDQKGLAFVKDKDLFDLAEGTKLFRDYFGPQITDRLMANPIFSLYDGNIVTKLKSLSTDLFTPEVPGRKKEATSLNGAISNLQTTIAANPKDGSLVPGAAQIYEGLMQHLDSKDGLLLNPEVSDDDKIRVIHSFFGPDNNGLMNRIAEDSMKGSKIYPGQYAFIQRAGSLDVAKEIMRVSQAKGDPSIFAEYENAIKTHLEQGLFRRDMQRLGGQNDSTTNLSTPPFGNEKGGEWHISWDDRNNIFRFNGGAEDKEAVARTNFYLGRAGLRNVTGTPAQQVHALVDRIDAGLYAISNIAKVTGEDVSAYTLKTLVQIVHDTSGGNLDLTKIPGIPGAMVEAILAARKKAEEEKPKPTPKVETQPKPTAPRPTIDLSNNPPVGADKLSMPSLISPGRGQWFGPRKDQQ